MVVFNAETVPVLCLALETAGRYLLLLPETQEHMRRMLERLAALRNSRGGVATSGPLADALDSAIFMVVPPPPSARTAAALRVRPPLVAFVRFLLLDALRDGNVDEVLRLVRKLPWAATAPASAWAPYLPPAQPPRGRAAPLLPPPGSVCVEDTVVDTFLSALKLDGRKLELLASLLAGLREYHERAAVRIMDGVVGRVLDALDGDGQEEAGVEGAPVRRAQRVLGAVRFLGEAYNYKLIDSPFVLRMCYTLLNAGHGVPVDRQALALEVMNAAIAAAAARRAAGLVTPADARLPPYPLVPAPTDPGVGGWGFHPLVPAAADPPTHVFRIRMVCVLLETCGMYFGRPPLAARMDRFLVYLQRYALCKSQVPMDTELALADVLAALRPSLVRFPNAAAAEAAAAALENEEAMAAARAAALNRAPDDDDDEDGTDDDDDDDDGGDVDDGGNGGGGGGGGGDGYDDEVGGVGSDNGSEEGGEEWAEGDGDGEGEEDEAAVDSDEGEDVNVDAAAAAAVVDEDEDDLDRELALLVHSSVDARRRQPDRAARMAAEQMTMPTGVAALGAGARSGARAGDDGVNLVFMQRGRGGGRGGDAHAVVVPRGVVLAERSLLTAEERRAEAALLRERTLALYAATEAADVLRAEAERRAARWSASRGGGAPHAYGGPASLPAGGGRGGAYDDDGAPPPPDVDATTAASFGIARAADRGGGGGRGGRGGGRAGGR